MKYSPAIYAKVFLETKPDIGRFLQVVEKKGDFGRIDKIVEAIEDLTTKEQGGRVVHLEFARETDLAKKLKFEPNDLVRVSINPSLVAGVRITVDGVKELDNSFRRKISNLFPNHLVT